MAASLILTRDGFGVAERACGAVSLRLDVGRLGRN